MSTTDTREVARGEAREVAGTTAQAAGDVAGTAKAQAGEVAADAASHARDLIDRTLDEASAQAEAQTERLARNLRALCVELLDMADAGGEPGSTAYGLVQAVAERGSRMADFVDSRGPEGLAAEFQDLGRRRPGAFLLGLAAAGFAAGRVAKAVTSADERRAPDRLPRPSAGALRRPSQPSAPGMTTHLPTGDVAGIRPTVAPPAVPPPPTPSPSGGRRRARSADDAWRSER